LLNSIHQRSGFPFYFGQFKAHFVSALWIQKAAAASFMFQHEIPLAALLRRPFHSSRCKSRHGHTPANFTFEFTLLQLMFQHGILKGILYFQSSFPRFYLQYAERYPF